MHSFPFSFQAGKKYAVLALTVLCWILLTLQTFSEGRTAFSQGAIPAFKSAPISESTDEVMPAFQYQTVSPLASKCPFSYKKINSTTIVCASAFSANTLSRQKDYILSKVQSIDKAATLTACHQEKNYTDFYLYCPSLYCQKNRSYNVQAALAGNKLYLGFPCITYDF